MLSPECTGCGQLAECSQRYKKAEKGEKIYCPDGTIHLADDHVLAIDLCFLRI